MENKMKETKIAKEDIGFKKIWKEFKFPFLLIIFYVSIVCIEVALK